MQTTIYLDCEVQRNPNPLEHWMPGYPEPLPEKQQWLDERRVVLEATVPAAETIRAPRNYTDPEKIAAYIQKKIREAQQRCDPEALEAEYEALEKAWKDKYTELHDQSALSAILGGEIWCVGIAVEEGPVKVLRAGSEQKLLSLLERGLENYPQAEIVAFNGFGYDFKMIAQRALKHDLQQLARRLWYDKPWGKHGLRDPRQAWSFGNRFEKGSLRALIGFLGDFEVPDWYDDIDHGQLDVLMREQPEVVCRMCEVDVEMLRHIDHRFQSAGWRT